MHRFFKIGLFLIALVLAFSLSGCGGTSEIKNKSDEKNEKTVNEIEKEDKGKNETESNSGETAPASGEQGAAVETSSTEINSQQTAGDNPPAHKNAGSGDAQTKPGATASSAPAQAPNTGGAQAPSTLAPAPAPSAPAPATKAEPVYTVTISIIGPKDRGAILSPVKVDINQGDTVSTVLLKAAGSKVRSKGSGSTFYVEGIDNIYEFDYGPQSGWIYQINGVIGSKSAGIVGVNDGDQIVWKYKEG